MKRVFIHGAICPMCLDKEQTQFVWSDMLHRYICWLCTVELCADFYPSAGKSSNYFLRAAEMLGFNEWICRRLYLQEVLMQRAAESHIDVDAEVCKRQIDAINEYLKALNENKNLEENSAARIILIHKIKERAFNCRFDDLIIPHNSVE